MGIILIYVDGQMIILRQQRKLFGVWFAGLKKLIAIEYFKRTWLLHSWKF